MFDCFQNITFICNKINCVKNKILKELVITIKNYRIMKKYVCTVCDWVYDPKVGDPDGGIAPGTAFEDIPEDWVCPVCGVGKDMFDEF